MIDSATGNRTPVSRVTGGDTSHYTIADVSFREKSNYTKILHYLTYTNQTHTTELNTSLTYLTYLTYPMHLLSSELEQENH